MEITKAQYQELTENYGVSERKSKEYLKSILASLKEKGLDNVNSDQLYNCLVYCCEQAATRTFEKEQKTTSKHLTDDIIVENAVNDAFAYLLGRNESDSDDYSENSFGLY